MVSKFNCLAHPLLNSLLIKYFKGEGKLSKHFTAVMLQSCKQISRTQRQFYEEKVTLILSYFLGWCIWEYTLFSALGLHFKTCVYVLLISTGIQEETHSPWVLRNLDRFMRCICVLKHIKTSITPVHFLNSESFSDLSYIPSP